MRVHGDNQPAAVRNGVAKFCEQHVSVGDQPPVGLEPCDKLVGDCAAIVVGVDEGHDKGE
jgi:hypothetical protein